MGSIVTNQNLMAGIEVWRSHKRWRQDFHNQLYIRLSDAVDLDDDSCEYLVDRLWDWRAIRPKRKSDILRGLASVRTELEVLSSDLGAAPIDELSWSQVSRLFEVANAIKGSSSPVFGSKLCHFLRPSAFPVIDRAVVGLRSREYRDYWEYCHEQWCGAGDQTSLVERLRREIGPGCADTFPFPTKVTELCLIGSRI